LPIFEDPLLKPLIESAAQIKDSTIISNYF